MQALICNKEHPEYGCAAIPFPIPDAEYAHCMEMLEALGIGGVMARDCYVDQFEDAPPVLDFLEGETVNIDELDFLMRSLDRYTGEEMAKFQSMAAAKGYTDMADLINLSFCCEQTTVITDFSDLEALGKSHYLAINGGCAPSETYKQLNGESIARELIASGSGVVTPYGVIYDNGMKLEPCYTGQSFPPYADQEYLMEVELEPALSAPEGTPPLTLFLPTSESRLYRLLDRAGFQSAEEFEIHSWRSEFPDEVNGRLDIPREGLFELNDLCAAVRGLDQTQWKKLSAVAAYAEPEGAFQIRQLAENLEQFEFVADIQTADDYGLFLIQESGHYDFDENLSRYYDYEKCGREQMESETGGFTALGYVSYHGTLRLAELMMEEPAAQEQTMGQQM